MPDPSLQRCPCLKSPSQIVYLLKSTFYSDYRQKILTFLSLPIDTEFIVEYDKEYVAEEIRRAPSKFEGMEACSVFVDYSLPSLGFWPIRRCKVVKILSPDESGTYQFFLKSGDHISPADGAEFSDKVRAYLQNRQFLETKNNEIWANTLVFCGDSSIIDLLGQGEREQVTWERNVKQLADTNDITGRGINQDQFKHSIFYRVSVLGRGETQPSVKKNGDYEFLPGKQYSLRFAVYQPHYKLFQTNDLKENIVDFPDELISHVGPKSVSLPAHQRKYTKYFDFWTQDLMAGGKSRFTVRLEGDEFNGPYVQLPFVVKPKRFQLTTLILLLVIGFLMLGLSDEIASIANSLGFIFVRRWMPGFLGAILSSFPIAWLEMKIHAR
jgi:hypothetical protein